MAAQKTRASPRAELRQEIVDLVPENTKGETKEFFVFKNNLFISTDIFGGIGDDVGAYIIVHASSLMAAVIVVLDCLNDRDCDMIYGDLSNYTGSTEWWVKQELRNFFVIKEHSPYEIKHLYEPRNGRSIKPVR